jgi:hypothetical protein
MQCKRDIEKDGEVGGAQLAVVVAMGCAPPEELVKRKKKKKCGLFSPEWELEVSLLWICGLSFVWFCFVLLGILLDSMVFLVVTQTSHPLSL